MEDSPSTLVHVSRVEDEVYKAMKTDLVTLQFAPGQRLRLEELAQRYGVSHTPIRQALICLERDGLILRQPHRGAVAAPLSSEELEALQVVRAGVECWLARLGSVRVTAPEVEEMSRRLARAERQIPDVDVAEFVAGLYGIRDICYRAADRPRLMKIAIDNRLQAERYIRFLIGTPHCQRQII